MSLARASFVLPALAAWLAGCAPEPSDAPPRAPRRAEAPLDEAPPPPPPPPPGPLPPPLRNVPSGRVTVQVLSEPTSLDTLVASQSAATLLVSDHLYESLVAADPAETRRFVAVPALAESWTVSPDGRTMTFTLRRGVEWHDGRPFTSRDVISTLDRAIDAASGAHEFRAYLAELESHRAPDDHTVVLAWRAPYFMALPALSLLPIQPAHVVVASLERSPMGTGPWRLLEWASGERITLEANPRHWGAGPHLERIEFRFVRERAAAARMLARGELDVVLGYGAELAPAAERRGFRRVELDENSMFWIGWNNERPMFRDARARRAMAHAFDWERVKEIVGPRPRRSCFFVPRPEAPDNPCDERGTPLPYSEADAARLLAEAGWTRAPDGLRDAAGARFRFEVVTTDLMARSPALRVLRDSLARLGVAMRITALGWPALVGRLRAGDFDACLLTWSEPIAESDPSQVFHSEFAGGGDNLVRFRDARADELMEGARREVDPVRRAVLFRELGSILREEQPVTFLEMSRRVSLVSPRVLDVRPTTRGWRYDEWRLDAP